MTTTSSLFADWPLQCPNCSARLEPVPSALSCRRCMSHYRIHDGVAELVDLSARPELQSFTKAYQTIRTAEGYTGRGAEYYRNLPTHPSSDPDNAIWRIRQHSFARLTRVLSQNLYKGGLVLDLGSGNGWLSHRLAKLGYRPMAMDINADPDDGLTALRHYPLQWPAVLGSFDQLPLSNDVVDMAIFNGSLHYSEDIDATLEEAFRVIRPGGSIVVMDTPIYHDPRSGAVMMAERQQYHLSEHGHAETMQTSGYLTWAMVQSWPSRLGCLLGVERPWYGLAWALRPIKARLAGAREPATFALLVLTRPSL